MRYFFLFLLFSQVFVSFAQQKRKTKTNSIVKQNYHDLTARDNAYFHAKIRLIETLKKWEDSYTDNYEEVLPLFIHEASDQKTNYYPDLDVVMEKAAKSIHRHHVSKWIDDCYLLIGRSHFYKGEYEQAFHVFQYIITEYKKGNKYSYYNQKDKRQRARDSKKRRKNYGQIQKKKKKKKKNSKEDDAKEHKQILHFLKHKKVNHETVLWVLRAYIAMGLTSDAQSLIALLYAQNELPDEILEQLELIKAHSFLTEGKWLNAVEPMTNAIEVAETKREKARQEFILAQVYERLEEKNKAIEHFQNVLDLSPDYELEYHSKINIAKNYHTNTNPEQIKKILLKMTKDSKNKDYLDQIYFLLSDIYLNEKDTTTAIEYAQLSVDRSTNNKNQKGKSYLKLGEIYYLQNNLRNTQQYYDSSLNYLDEEYDNYSYTERKRDALTQVVERLNIIGREDTLQLLANMTVPERETFLNKVIASKIDQSEQQEKVKQKNESINEGFEGSWYFYNNAIRSKGIKEFISIWGDIKLENNWRRQNKTTNEIDIEEEEKNRTETSIEQKMLEYKAKMLQSLPNTPEKLAQSNQRVNHAKYELGLLYKYNLELNNDAIYIFEDLLQKDPQNKNRLYILYNLYLLHFDENHLPEAKKYKNLIIQEFPNSLFAKRLIDPNFKTEEELQKEQIGVLYATAYKLYEEEAYDLALGKLKSIETTFGEHPLKSKCELLEAYIIGRTQDKKAYREALAEILANKPSQEIEERVTEIINFLDKKHDKEKYKKIYSVNFDDKHFVSALIINQKVKEMDIKNALSDYNKEYHRHDDLSIRSYLIDNRSMVVVEEFENKTKSNEYFIELDERKDLFGKSIKKTDYILFLISSNNLIELLKDNSVETYLDFYGNEYLEKDE